MVSNSPHPRRFWALFCTTEVPAQFITKVLSTCEESSKHTPNIPDDTANIWSLILTPTQTHFDKPTTPPFTSDPTTGFINATHDDIGAFLTQHFAPLPKNIPKSGFSEIGIAHDAFALIDARTLEDETLVLVRWEAWNERIDPTSEDDREEAWRFVRGWRDVRVPLEMATEVVGGLGLDLLIHDFREQLGVGDEGVCCREGVGRG